MTTATDPFPGIDTETLQCFAGHEWCRPTTKGGKPTTCPEHHRFLVDPISPRLQPPQRILDLWEETAVLDEPDEYVRRWRKFWDRTVRILAARFGTFASIDPMQVEEYVRHVQLAEKHRAYAEFDPYQTTAQGSIKPHPGWWQAQLEDKLARQVGIRLGLIVLDDPKAKKKEEDVEDDDDDVASDYYDDQIGPDGNPL